MTGTRLSGALLIVALVGVLAGRKISSVGVTGVIVVVALFGLGAATEEPDPARGLMAVEQSPYAELRVVDVDDIRYMLIDGSIHTMVDTRTHESHFPYVHVLDVLNHIVADPGEAYEGVFA